MRQDERERDVEIRDAWFPLDPTRCKRCGWPIAEKIDDGCTVLVCRFVTMESNFMRYDEPPHFSTDPAASKQLREKLAEKYAVHTVLFRKELQTEGKRASARLIRNGDVIVSLEAATEELAVVLCALKLPKEQK